MLARFLSALAIGKLAKYLIFCFDTKDRKNQGSPEASGFYVTDIKSTTAIMKEARILFASNNGRNDNYNL